jgi:hypothetical protein
MIIFMPIFAAIVSLLLFQELVLPAFFIVGLLEFVLITAVTLSVDKQGNAKPRF